MVYLRSTLVLITIVLLEVEVLSRLRVFDVAMALVLAVSAASGLTGGPDRGAIFGFLAGLVLDMYLPTPLGLSAASFAIAAYLIGFASGRIVESSLATRIGFVAVGTVIGVCLYVGVGEILGQSGLYNDDFWRILGVIVAMNAVVGAAAVPLTTWMWDLSWTDRDL